MQDKVIKSNIYSMGVLGGMGSKSTSYFLGEIFNMTDAKSDQEHINLIALNHSTLADRTELINKGESEPLVSDMVNDIKILHNLGVTFVSIPCNTVFHFMNRIKENLKEQNINIEIISIVDTCASYINTKFNNKNRKEEKLKVGILGTDGAVTSNIYKSALSEYDIDTLYPDALDQAKVQRMIYEDVKSGMDTSSESLMNLISKMQSEYKCDIVVLGCTELSVMRRGQYLPDYCIDALDILVSESIIKSGKQIKFNF